MHSNIIIRKKKKNQSTTSQSAISLYDVSNFSVSDNSPKERPEKYTIIQCFSFKFNCLITNSLIVFLKEGKTRNTSLVQTNKHSCLSIKCFQQSAFTPICKPIGFSHCRLSPGQWKNSLHALHAAICENRHYSHSVSKAALDKGKKNICFTVSISLAFSHI